MSALVPFTELLEGWSEDDPQYGPDLVKHQDLESLAPMARQLRAHFTAVLPAVQATPLNKPARVYSELRNDRLQPKDDRWYLYALDEGSRPLRVPRKAGGMQKKIAVHFKAPHADDLPALPDGGKWLVIWGGGPEVLDIPGVTHRLARLRTQANLADIVFCDRSTSPMTAYFVRAGAGVRGGEFIPFPDPARLDEVRTPLENT